MQESDLTEKQRKWLEESRKIGPGAMTKSERERLEKLYADMLPAEQQELQQYIQLKYGKKDDPDQQSDKMSEMSMQGDPTVLMEKKEWSAPSDSFRNAFSSMNPRKRD